MIAYILKKGSESMECIKKEYFFGMAVSLFFNSINILGYNYQIIFCMHVTKIKSPYLSQVSKPLEKFQFISMLFLKLFVKIHIILNTLTEFEINIKWLMLVFSKCLVESGSSFLEFSAKLVQ